MDKLRPYQAKGIKDIFEEWRSGKRSVLFQMPTGTGKTVLFSEIVGLGHKMKRKILIVAHRKELVEQIINKLKNYDVDAGIIMAGVKPDYSKIVQVASIQTLTRREHPEANLIIIDECHHARADSYSSLWKIYPDAKFLGVTATPIRMNGEGFNDLFDVLIPTMQITEFIEKGYLSEIKHLVTATPNLKGVKKQRGDYVPEMLKGVMLENHMMGNLVSSYKENALGKSTIVFAVDIEHSQNIVQRYSEAGIEAVHIDSQTPKNERHEILNAFKQKEIKIISNVEIVTEGFDFPECEVVQLARPTKSLSLYLQMVGRVMRKAPDKDYGILLDNAGLWLEHGLATINRDWTLDGIKKGMPKNNVIKDEFAGIDDEGLFKTVERKRPSEVDGLILVELTYEIKRLFVFEQYVQLAKNKQYKPISAYHKYKTYLEEKHIDLTQFEFNYIKARLNKINDSLPLEKQFKKGFWFMEEKTLKELYPNF